MVGGGQEGNSNGWLAGGAGREKGKTPVRAGQPGLLSLVEETTTRLHKNRKPVQTRKKLKVDRHIPQQKGHIMGGGGRGAREMARALLRATEIQKQQQAQQLTHSLTTHMHIKKQQRETEQKKKVGR